MPHMARDVSSSRFDNAAAILFFPRMRTVAAPFAVSYSEKGDASTPQRVAAAVTWRWIMPNTLL